MITCPPPRPGIPPSAENADCFDIAGMHDRLSNWATDRFGALGLIALAFPNQPNASAWLAIATHELRWQLANGMMPDGQWNEPTTR
jgi:hypothetical protein